MDKNRIKLNQIIENISPIDPSWVEKARERTGLLCMPPRALGRLHDISERLCGIAKTLAPSLAGKAILVMAGDHGVAAEGVSAYPQEVTGEMVRTFINGAAGINAITRLIGAEVWVVDVGIRPQLDLEELGNPENLVIAKVAPGTDNMARGPAMTPEAAVKAVLIGFRQARSLFERGIDILGTGDMGIGNTTPSAAVGAVFSGTDLDEMVGRGTGVDDAALAAKRKTVARAIEVNQPDPRDGIDVLAKVGGFEIGAIAGCILAAAHYSRPVVIDGFISTAGALVANSLCPTTAQYVFAGHCSAESGHGAMLRYIGHKPILDLGMRLGEGTGGALAMGVMEAAVRVFSEVATFAEAGVTDKQE